MAGKKLYEGTNIGQVNISVRMPANNLEEARRRITDIISDHLPDLSTENIMTGITILYSFDKTFEETEVKEIKG